MGLFKKKSEIKSLQAQKQYDELKEAYEKLKYKYDVAISQHINDKCDYIKAKETIKNQREFILQLQNKIYTLQEELIAKNKIIQGMDNSDQ